MRVMLRLSGSVETREVIGLSGGIGGRNGCGDGSLVDSRCRRAGSELFLAKVLQPGIAYQA